MVNRTKPPWVKFPRRFFYVIHLFMKRIRKISKSKRETREIAENFAKELCKSKDRKTATVIAMVGDLGSGKTTFVQYFAKALGVKEYVTSPTFVLLKKYNHLIHIDAYRLDGPEDLKDLNWNEIIKDPKNIILIEWADKIKKALPKEYFLAVFSHKGEKSRGIDIKQIK